MLALDFDGVVADALVECAAVTWYGAQLSEGEAAPRLPQAIHDIPEEFLSVFRAVRAYSRNMDDFMVANALYGTSDQIDRARFEQARSECGPTVLAAQAAQAEAVRSQWRQSQFNDWIALHQIQPQLSTLIAESDHKIRIISAKDADSISVILRHYGLDEKIDLIEGQCHDKKDVLSQWLNQAPPGTDVLFVDDSVENVADAANLDITPIWAGWGYHGPEDIRFAKDRNIKMYSLDTLTQERFLKAKLLEAD